MAEKNLIACNLASYGKYQESAYAHLPSLGIRYVEFPIPSENQLPQVQEKLRTYGLSTVTLMAPCDLSSDAGIEEFCKALPVAKTLGARILFVSAHAGDTPLDSAYARLRAMGDAAAEFGMKIGIETHPDLAHNGDIALQTLKAVNHPAVGINYDSANVYYYNQNIDGVEELKKILDYVVSVHLKDTNGGYRTWYFPAFGEGIVRFSEIFCLLNDRGFYGPFTMEIEGIEGENLTEEQTKERVAKSVAYLRSLGVFE